MQLLGAQPVDLDHPNATPADLLVQPENNVDVVRVPADMVSSSEVLELHERWWVTTMSEDRAAGFYTSFWGVMPFTFGSVPDEGYLLIRWHRVGGPPSAN
jgi:hypothetical protein